MLNRNSPVPLYHQLAELLMADIEAGTYAQGDAIPSENALVARHGIGRPTVRQAIESLVRKGVLIRRRGAGTFVAPRPEPVDLFSLGGTMASFSGTGISPTVEIIQQPRLERIANGEANPFTGGEAIFFSRLNLVDDTPVLVEDIYLEPDLFPGLPDMDMSGQSLSRLAEERYHLRLSGGEQQFAIDYPNGRLSKLLQLPRSTPILAVNRTLHFPQAERAIYSSLYCRTDRFVFTQTLGGLTPHA